MNCNENVLEILEELVGRWHKGANLDELARFLAGDFACIPELAMAATKNEYHSYLNDSAREYMENYIFSWGYECTAEDITNAEYAQLAERFAAKCSPEDAAMDTWWAVFDEFFEGGIPARGYQGLFIDKDSCAELIRREEKHLSNPVRNMHITFRYGTVIPYPYTLKSPYPWERRTWDIKVTHYACNGKNSAFACILPDELNVHYANGVTPHITVSLSDGAKAVDSGNLKFEKLDEPFTVSGYLDEVIFGYEKR